jgi:hypothetical protein
MSTEPQTEPRGECRCRQLATTPMTWCESCRVREALTTPCGRCKGRGKESWQVSRNVAEGREDWPCVGCGGAGKVTDVAAVERVLAALAVQERGGGGG